MFYGWIMRNHEWVWSHKTCRTIKTAVNAVKSLTCNCFIYLFVCFLPESDWSFSAAPPSSSSRQEQLLPLVVTLRDCVREAASKAKAAMTFVVLQGALSATVAQGPTQILQRRHAVFSQAVRTFSLKHVLGSKVRRIKPCSCSFLSPAVCGRLRLRPEASRGPGGSWLPAAAPLSGSPGPVWGSA